MLEKPRREVSDNGLPAGVPGCQSADDCGRAERRDERVESEDHNQQSIQKSERTPDRQRQQDRCFPREPLVDDQPGDHELAQAEVRCDRQVEFPGDQRQEDREREQQRRRLIGRDHLEIEGREVGRRLKRREQSDDQDRYDHEPVAGECVGGVIADGGAVEMWHRQSGPSRSTDRSLRVAG